MCVKVILGFSVKILFLIICKKRQSLQLQIYISRRILGALFIHGFIDISDDVCVIYVESTVGQIPPTLHQLLGLAYRESPRRRHRRLILTENADSPVLASKMLVFMPLIPALLIYVCYFYECIFYWLTVNQLLCSCGILKIYLIFLEIVTVCMVTNTPFSVLNAVHSLVTDGRPLNKLTG